VTDDHSAVNLILIGYRCTGKSSVGKKIAERLGLSFLDTDDVVEARAGQTIREIVEGSGWSVFRKEERAAIREAGSLKQAVVATGGGAVMDPENRAVLSSSGLVVWLAASEATILRRLVAGGGKAGGRPPLTGMSLELETRETLEKRTPVYRALARLTVDTEGRTVEEVAEEICRSLPGNEPNGNP
jgi:shikimate kinase